jgi:uncharacterized protein (TIGR02246 family)
MKLSWLILAFSLAALPSVGHAKSLTQKDVDAVVQKYQSDYADTFNRRDAKAMGALLTENATMQNEWGDVKQGRGNIESLVSGLMAKLPTGTKLEDTALVSQSVAPNVIVSQGISRRIVPKEEPAQMFFSRVLVLDKGQWKMAATQIARPSSVPKPIASPSAK